MQAHSSLRSNMAPGATRAAYYSPFMILARVVRFAYHPYRFDGRVETAFRGGLCLCKGSSD